MRNKREEQFYHKLSRKELQCLCKKYGLPANKSSSEMAKLLASYFANMSSMSSRQRLRGTQEALVPTFMMTELQPGASFHYLEDTRKDSNGSNSCPTDERNRSNYSQTVRRNEFGHCVGDKTCDKENLGCSMYCFQETPSTFFASQCDRNDFNSMKYPTTIFCKNCSGITRDGRVEDMCSIQQTYVNFFSCPKESASSSTVKTIETASPSFEFYVRSEEGINLCVDLNSTPSDWIKKLKSEVNICENICHSKSPSFHQDLGRIGDNNKQIKSSFLWDIDAHQGKDYNMQSKSSPSILMKENNQVMLDHPERGDGSLTSVAIKPSGFSVVVSERVQVDQGVIWSEPNSDARDGIHSSTDENGCVTNLDSDVVNSPRKELGGNSIVDTSDCPLSLVSFEHQNSKPSSEICEAQENSCSLLNSQLEIAGCLVGSSSEMPLSEAEIEQNASFVACENAELLDLVCPTGNTETEQSRLANSSEPNLDICRNHLPTSVEELERSKVIEVEEGSEFSQFNGSFEKTCSSVDNKECSEELFRKKPCVENDDQTSRCRPDAKILRNLKHFDAKEFPRRSTWLVSKVWRILDHQKKRKSFYFYLARVYQEATARQAESAGHNMIQIGKTQNDRL